MENRHQAKNAAESNLRAHFREYGLLSCNQNAFLPSIDDVGGDWSSMVTLLERREAFYSKVYRKRTTYLSKELYFLLKRHKQREEALPAGSRKILGFLRELGSANTTTIRDTLQLPGRSFSKHFDVLLQEMLVTVVRRDVDLNPSWSSFVWGVHTEWERGVRAPSRSDDRRLHDLLRRCLAEREVAKLLRRNDYSLG